MPARSLSVFVALLLAVAVAGCATGPQLRTDYDRSEVRTRPSATVGVGYYGYRYGLYTAWPMYQQEVDTVHYRVGTANIDVVDAERKQLIWEGVAEGRLTREALENPKPAIERTVHDLFMQFPTRTDTAAKD